MDTNTPPELDWNTQQKPSATHTHPFPLPTAPRQRGKRLRTDPSMDYQLWQEEGYRMLCGNTAMEAILRIARTTATRFKMQGPFTSIPDTRRGSGPPRSLQFVS